MKYPFILITFLLVSAYRLAAQSQEDFTQGYVDVVVKLATDTASAEKMGMELYQLVEDTEELQTMANYMMLKVMFEMQIPNEEMAKECEKKANALIPFGQNAVQKPTSYNSPMTEWAYEYQMELYKDYNADLVKRAIKFLNEHPELQSYQNMAVIAKNYVTGGYFKKAGEIYDKAVTLIKYDGKDYSSVHEQADFYMKSGQYEKVEELIEINNRLKEVADPTLRATFDYVGEAMDAQYYVSIGDYFNYIRIAKKQTENLMATMQDETSRGAQLSTIFTLQGIGFEMLGEWQQAEDNYRKGDSTYNAFTNKMRETYPTFPDYNFPRQAMFQARYGTLTDKEAALAARNKAQQAMTQSGYALPLSSYHQEAQDYAFMKETYESLYEGVLQKTKNGRDFTEATKPYSYYAYFLMRDKKFRESKKLYDELFKLNLQWINDVIFTFGEKSFVAYYNSKFKEGYDNFHSFVKLHEENPINGIPNLTAQAYDNLLLTKSIAFKGIRKRKKAFIKSNDPQVVELYNQWISKKQELIQLFQLSQIDREELEKSLGDPSQVSQNTATVEITQDSIDALQTEVNLLESRLTSEAKDFKSTLKIEAPDWKAIRSKLKPGEAAIEMIRFNWRDQRFYSDTAYYAAYIIKHDSKVPEVLYLPAQAELLDSRYYRVYQNSIKLKIEDNTSYDQYWNPIKEQLPGIKKVYFSPDGIYHLINLPTLRNPGSGDYLIDEIEVRNVTSTGDLTNDSNGEPIKEAILFGRPTYDTRNLQASLEQLSTRSFSKNFRNANVSDLPGTEDEVKIISKELSEQGVGVQQYLGASATEDQFYELQSPDVLHIATHGFWSGVQNATPGYRMFNAMVNSGLLLTGVVDYYSSDEFSMSNDGILTAYEAQGLELEGTELVVLSACETGLGDFDAGEGVYGLQRAFRAAGSKSIMTSLWKVDDQGTKDFMISFYKNLIKLDNKQEAFKAAQLEMKTKYTDPYYWGAFVLVGD